MGLPIGDANTRARVRGLQGVGQVLMCWVGSCLCTSRCLLPVRASACHGRHGHRQLGWGAGDGGRGHGRARVFRVLRIKTQSVEN